MLTGMRWGDWVNLLRQRQSWQLAQEGPLLFRLSLQSLLNEGLYHLEERYLGGTVDAVSSAPPLMVLGFWRSGTSWLQQLLAQDPALAYPTALQAFNPHTFFFWQGRLENPRLHQLATACGRALWGQPKQRWKRPGDGLPAGLHLPEEDEVALSMFGISPRSVYEALGLGSFPQRPVQDYLQALGNYRPAQDPPLQSGLRTRLGLAWKPYFEAFGYPP
jgi:hypothetical protein